jgi:hypothetical protein
MFSKLTVYSPALTITTVTLPPELEGGHPQPMERNVPSFLPPLRVEVGCRGSLKEGLRRSLALIGRQIVHTSFVAVTPQSLTSHVLQSCDCSVCVLSTLPTGRPKNRASILGGLKRLSCPPKRPDRPRWPG